MAFAEQGCCEQVLCHNKIMAVDKGGYLGDTYPYPPTTSRRPEVAPNLEVVAFATTLDYTHTLGLGAPLPASHSQVTGERRGSRSVGGGGTPPWLSRGAETVGG